MSKFNSKKEWFAEAKRLKESGLSAPEVAKIVGEFSPTPGQRYSIHNSSKNGVVAVDMEARLARGNKRANMERSQSLGIGDTEMPRNTTSKTKKAENGVGPGMELHHRNSLIQNTPFYDGLSDSESREFTSWARQQGWELGNSDGNTNIPLKISDHKGVHAWMRESGIEGARGPQRRLTDMFQGMSLEDRKYAFRNYMAYVQGGVDEHMAATLGDVSVSPKHTDAQARNQEIVNKQNEVELLKHSLGSIPTGPRAGQRLPVNRRTLGDAVIRDTVKPPFSEVAQSAFESEILDKVPPNAFASVVSSKVPPKTTSAPQSTVRTPTTTPSTPKPTQTKTTPTGYVHRNRTPSETPPVTVSKTPPPTVLENLNTGLRNASLTIGAIGAGAYAIGKDMLFGFNP